MWQRKGFEGSFISIRHLLWQQLHVCPYSIFISSSEAQIETVLEVTLSIIPQALHTYQGIVKKGDPKFEFKSTILS